MSSKNISTNVFKEQVGGDHYKNMAIQPATFITLNHVGWLPGCVITRMCRFDKPGGGGMIDLAKAIHEIEMMMEFMETKGNDDHE